LSKKYFKLGSQNESEVLIHFGEGALEELQCISTYKEKKCNISNYEKYNPHLSLVKNNKQETTKLCNETHKMQYLCNQDERHPWKRNTDDLGNAHQNFILQPKTLLDGEDRIILVTDEQGMGKSTLLTYLAKQTQEHHHNVCTVIVSIIYASILHEIKTNGFDEKSANKLITEPHK